MLNRVIFCENTLPGNLGQKLSSKESLFGLAAKRLWKEFFGRHN